MAAIGLNQLTAGELLNLGYGALGFKRLAAATAHVADQNTAGTSTTVSAWVKTTGSELVTNGAFVTDTGWAKGTGWTIPPESYTASDGTQTGDSDLTQDITAINGTIYQTVYTVASYSAGNVVMVIGDQEGADRSSNSTFTEYITSGAGSDLDIRADINFIGRVDTITAKVVSLGSELVTTGDFVDDQGWIHAADWEVTSGKATSDGTQAGDSDLTQDITAVNGTIYQIVFVVSGYSAGNVTPVVGDTEGTDRASNATFTEYITAGAATDVDIRADVNFVGSVDDVVVREVVVATDLITNGTFDTDTGWVKGDGWTISGNNASSDGSQGADSDLTQDITAANGTIYQVTYTVSGYSAGNVTAVVGDTEGTDRGGNGTFVEYITAGAGSDIDIRADVNFVGDIDDVIVKVVSFNSDLVTNGAFAATPWTKGTGWVIAAGVASSDGTQGADADLTQDITAVTSSIYQVVFTVSNWSAGNATAVVGDTEGVDHGANGTFTEYIICGAGSDIDIRADVNFVGDIDNLTVKLVTLGGDLVTNGGFATDTDWTKGTGWAIVSGASSDGSQGADSDLTQSISALDTVSYDVTFKVTAQSAGNVTPVVGDNEGTDRSTVEEFSEAIVSGSGTDIDIRADVNFVGTIDDVSVKVSNTYVVGNYASHGGADYICISDHAAADLNEPGTGGSWATYWKLLVLYTGVTQWVEVVALNANLVYAGTCVASVGDIPLVDDKVLEGESHRFRFTTIDIKTGVGLGYYR